MSKKLKKNISIILVAAMLITSCPFSVFADEGLDLPVNETVEVTNEDSVAPLDGALDATSEPTHTVSESIRDIKETVIATENDADYKVATHSNAETYEAEKTAEVEEVSETTPSNASYFDSTSDPIDGIKVRVTADEGVFPVGSKLVVNKVTKSNENAEDIEAAVDNAKLLEDDEEKNEPEAYTFDIKVVDKDGNELQPKDDAEVNVSFERVENKKALLEAKVFHLEKTDEKKIEELEELVKEANAADDEDDFDYSLLDGEVIDNVSEGHNKVKDKTAEIIAKKEIANNNEISDELVIKDTAFEAVELNTEIKEESNVVETTTDGFSYYVVEFYYGNYEYVLGGDSEVELSVILETLMLSDEIDETKITKIEVSDNTLFVPLHIENGENSNEYVWYVKALKAFATEEWMRISVKDENNDDLVYEIKVTDSQDDTTHDNNDCITFSSNASFTLNTTKGWDGVLYYSTDKNSWTEWDGSSITATQKDGAGDFCLYLYGTSANTIITNKLPWNLSPTNGHTIACSGNIETLRGATGNNPSSTKMGKYCYYKMFFDCTSLSKAPELPAKTLSNFCYYAMFRGCTGLTKAPSLPATTLYTNCYEQMFHSCSSLTSAPNLPSKTMKSDCYYQMFNGCTSLSVAPQLPATAVAYECYMGMFKGCTSLTIAPDLPATVMQESCYSNMFQGCSALTEAPALSAEALAEKCYYRMFYGCSSLKVSDVGGVPIFTCPSTIALDAVSDMFTSTGGEFKGTPVAGSTYYYEKITQVTFDTNGGVGGTTSSNAKYGFAMPAITTPSKSGYTFEGYYDDISATTSDAKYYNADGSSAKNWDKFVDTTLTAKWAQKVDANYLTFTKQEAEAEIAFYPLSGTVEYSTDNGDTWNEYRSDYYIKLRNDCPKVCFRGNNVTTNASHKFVISGKVAASGSVTSLTDGKGIDSNVVLSNICYSYMFANCTDLVSAPELPAATLQLGCYNNMFNGCTSLISAPSLPATTLADHCYFRMFEGCTSLLVAPKLPATELKEYCYREMFIGCTGLTTAPELPATTLAERCYSNMFNGCASLTTVPDFPEAIMASNCCNAMFNACSSLITPPKLPSSALAVACYANMFSECTSLTTAPELPATTLVASCYYDMFSGCTSLHVSDKAGTIIFTCPDTIPTSAVGNMFTSTAGPYTVNPLSGNTYYNANVNTITLDQNGGTGGTTSSDAIYLEPMPAIATPSKIGYVFEGYYDDIRSTSSDAKYYNADGTSAKNWDKTVDTTLTAKWTQKSNCLTFTAQEANSTIAFTPLSGTVEYSMGNGDTWNDFTSESLITLENVGDIVLFRGNNVTTDNTHNFVMTGKIAASGSVTSLTDGKGMNPDVTLSEWCYLSMFENCTALTTAPELPATTLDTGCYASMFNGCTSLVSTPVLPATALSAQCYQNMFYGCVGLTTTPALPATTLGVGCYYYMFSYCTGLTTAPMLPATTLTANCYQYMFDNCTGLTTAPVLPATTLELSCYSHMFNGCSALTSAPELPATTLSSHCYQNMFSFCTSLTEAPTLLASTLADGCYSRMFDGCIGITKAPTLPATTLKENCYFDMFTGCKGLTKAPELPATTLAHMCYTGMFMNCTNLKTAPELPATKLASSCYSYMFYNCTSLSTAPKLSATTLADSCYQQMFMGCTSLKVSDNGGTKIFTCPNTIPTDAVSYMFTSTGGPFTGTPISGNTYYYINTNLVTFNTNGGIGGTTSSNATYGEPMPAISTPSKAGYTFEGYFDDLSATSSDAKYYNADGTGAKNWDKTEDTTLIAKWTKDEANYLTFTAQEANSTIKFAPASGTVEYSIDDGSSWKNANGVTVKLKKVGDKVLYRGNNITTDSNHYFVMTGKIAAGGSVTSLTDGIGTDSNVALSPACYIYMFQGCTSLTTAPELPATTLASDCYCDMFLGCTGLTKAPALPATTLAQRCYYAMFWSCTSLIAAPKLPASELKAHCYHSMFQSCTSLTTAPELPATTLAESCYQYIFADCINLTTAPALPAITLVKDCYVSMFNGCTSLTVAPQLPATTIAEFCYMSMFSGCTSLIAAPKLPASELKPYCYESMFYGCTSLTTAPELPATKIAKFCYREMFNGCTSLRVSDKGGTAFFTCPETIPYLAVTDMFASTGGPFIGTPNASSTYYNAIVNFVTFNSNGGIGGTTSSNATYGEPMPAISTPSKAGYTFEGYYDDLSATSSDAKYYNADGTSAKNWDKTEDSTLIAKWAQPTESCYLTFTAQEANSTIKLTPASGTTIFSTDNGVTWNDASGVTVTLANVGDKVLYKGNNVTTDSTHKFVMSGKIAAGGSVTSLTDGIGMDPDVVLSESCYQYMFEGCSSLLTAPALPATTLVNNCYCDMFSGCTGLTKAPALPATSLASSCYGYMFHRCTSLTTAPELPATTLASGCYGLMFYGCTSLKVAPILPATSLPSTCYMDMFHNCTSLTSAPELPSTTLAEYCYLRMFEGCTSLTSAPTLPATTLTIYCYNAMFKGCSSLSTAPELPATVLENSCYKDMFNGCASLKNCPSLPATSLATSCYTGMFSGCSSLTIAPSLPATILTGSCYKDMFNGCTSLTTVPALPATSLDDGCYYGMFKGCTSLTTAPTLPATTLAKECYYEMFYGCTSLASAPELSATSLATYCYYSMFRDCTSLTTAPELPATTLSTYCYQYMFYGCTSLAKAPLLPATTLKTSCYNNMFNGCSSLKVSAVNGTKIFTCPSSIPSGAVTNMFTSTAGPFTGKPTSGNTYYNAFEYLVTLDSNGGIGGSTSSNATYDLPMPTITIPSKTCYAFEGYYLDINDENTKYYKADGTSAKNWDRTEDTTLYAKWLWTPEAIIVETQQTGSISDMLNDATNGQTVQLLDSATYSDAEYTVKTGITLDVAGYRLAAKNILLEGSSSALADTGDGDGAVVLIGNKLIASGNTYMPLYDSSISDDSMNGYRLYRYSVTTTAADPIANGTSYFKIKFKIYFYKSDGKTQSQKAYDLLANEDGDTKLRLSVGLTHYNKQGISTNYNFNYSAESTQAYGKLKSADINKEIIMYLNVLNYKKHAGSTLDITPRWNVDGGYTYSASGPAKSYYIDSSGKIMKVAM